MIGNLPSPPVNLASPPPIGNTTPNTIASSHITMSGAIEAPYPALQLVGDYSIEFFAPGFAGALTLGPSDFTIQVPLIFNPLLPTTDPHVAGEPYTTANAIFESQG